MPARPDVRPFDAGPPPTPAAAGPRVSVYDLDRTLTRRGTYLPFLLFAARRLAPWRLLRLPEVLAAMAGYKLGLLTRGRLKEVMQAQLLGPAVAGARMRPAAEAFADAVVRRGLRAGVAARLRADLQGGRTVVIATAAHRLYAEPIARRLGVEHLVATGSAWSGDHLLAQLDGPNRRGPAKLDALEAWLAERPALAAAGFRLHSDDASDLPSFERAAERVAVHPGPRLHRIARARGWEVLR